MIYTNLEEFKESFRKNKSDFHVLVRKFTDLPQKQSDSGNGYYIVSDVWGTCFHRIATKKEKFEVKYIKNRSYTKIPKIAINNVYQVVVNFKEQAFEIKLPENERFIIIGIHEQVSHVSKDYYTQSFLIYTKTDEINIEIIETELEGGLWIRTKTDDLIRPASLFKYDVNFIKPF